MSPFSSILLTAASPRIWCELRATKQQSEGLGLLGCLRQRRKLADESEPEAAADDRGDEHDEGDLAVAVFVARGEPVKQLFHSQQ